MTSLGIPDRIARFLPVGDAMKTRLLHHRAGSRSCSLAWSFSPGKASRKVGISRTLSQRSKPATGASTSRNYASPMRTRPAAPTQTAQKKAMMAASEFQELRRRAQERRCRLSPRDYVDLDAHFAEYIAHRELKNDDLDGIPQVRLARAIGFDHAFRRWQESPETAYPSHRRPRRVRRSPVHGPDAIQTIDGREEWSLLRCNGSRAAKATGTAPTTTARGTAVRKARPTIPPLSSCAPGRSGTSWSPCSCPRASRCCWPATRSGRTQAGNNNAYCQDNEISWVDWRARPASRTCSPSPRRWPAAPRPPGVPQPPVLPRPGPGGR